MKCLPALTTLVALCGTVAPVIADSSVSDASKSSWSEHCGWMNWRDAGDPIASQGVTIDPSGAFLSGFIWCENVGWINLGDGDPAGGAAYANLTGEDFGVNIDVGTGYLSGLAWGENIGWINFTGGYEADGPATAARLSLSAPQRMLGYAWAENAGWINLDLAEYGQFVQIETGNGCDSIDFNGDGLFPDTGDIDDFISVFSGGTCADPGVPCSTDIDFNNDGLFPDTLDIDSFISVFSGGRCL